MALPFHAGRRDSIVEVEACPRRGRNRPELFRTRYGHKRAGCLQMTASAKVGEQPVESLNVPKWRFYGIVRAYDLIAEPALLYFDDIQTDYRSRIGSWTLTENEIIEFATQWDPRPFHIDRAAAAESVFGTVVASSLHLFAICTRLFVDHDDDIAVQAMLGKDEIRIPNPARAGDTLQYWTECVERRLSSKPDRGVIVLADRLINQDGDTVMTQRVSLLVARR